MKHLPHKEDCFVEEQKIKEYLLNTTRMPGAAKAKFFQPFGFSSENWIQLANALEQHGHTQELVHTIRSSYGTKYTITGPLTCPDGRTPIIQTIWHVHTDALAPRLITAYPI
ncbi:MAG: DUF6883 domain-containing protein [Coraliomargaritaceae bacterium]